MLLSQNPEAEAKLHDELEVVLRSGSEGVQYDSESNTLPTGRVSAFRSPTVDDIPRLTFTEAMIAESMRLYPPAWAIGRKAVADHELAGYRIPANSVVLA